MCKINQFYCVHLLNYHQFITKVITKFLLFHDFVTDQVVLDCSPEQPRDLLTITGITMVITDCWLCNHLGFFIKLIGQFLDIFNYSEFSVQLNISSNNSLLTTRAVLLYAVRTPYEINDFQFF